MKNVIKLSLISELKTKEHAVLKIKDGAMIRGEDINGYDFECGNCNALLATGVFRQQIRNIVLVCGKCERYNMIQADWSVYVFKYIKEEVNVPAVVSGFFLMLMVSIISNMAIQTKVFLNIAIFIVSLSYKYIIQVFQEK